MRQALLLCGGPGTGKTTLIKEALTQKRIRAGGFYTEEIRSGGWRQGFRLVTLDGETATLAHTSFPGPYRVSRYGVDLSALDQVGVPALRQATREREMVVIDEIGKMELCSEAFREAVTEALGSGKKVVGTIMLAPHPWADRIKGHPQVEVVMVTRANREQVAQRLARWLEAEGRPVKKGDP